MQLRDVMTTDVKLTDPATNIMDAAAMMRDGDFGLLPVGENDRLVGTITDRDITVRAIAEGKNPRSTTVREAMSEGVRYCYEDQMVEEAANAMGLARVRRMPVINRDKRLVGIVALADLATTPRASGPAAAALSGISKD